MRASIVAEIRYHLVHGMARRLLPMEVFIEVPEDDGHADRRVPLSLVFGSDSPAVRKHVGKKGRDSIELVKVA